MINIDTKFALAVSSFKGSEGMKKRISSVLLIIIFVIGIYPQTASAKISLNLSSLKNCKFIFNYSGNSAAYFFGISSDTLYSAKVIPSQTVFSAKSDKTIRAACHDDLYAYALCMDKANNCSVLQLNMSNGKSDSYPIVQSSEIITTSFAVANGEVYLIHYSKTDSYVVSYSLNGTYLRKYSAPMGVETLFVNDAKAYLKSKSGEIFRLSGADKIKCAQIDTYEAFSNAGVGYIFTENNRLINLSNGTEQTIEADFHCAVKTSKALFRASAGKIFADNRYEYPKTNINMLAAVNNQIAALSNDCQTEIISKNEFAVKDAPPSSSAPFTANKDNSQSSNNSKPFQGTKYKITDNYILGVAAGTTVTAFKQNFDVDITIYNANGKQVTSGKIKTGYTVNYAKKIYTVCVTGDVTGEGNVNSRDVKALMEHLIDKNTLNNCYLRAADCNYDNTVDNRDLVLMAKLP